MQMIDTLIISHSYLFIKACSLRTYIRYNFKLPFSEYREQHIYLRKTNYFKSDFPLDYTGIWPSYPQTEMKETYIECMLHARYYWALAIQKLVR